MYNTHTETNNFVVKKFLISKKKRIIYTLSRLRGGGGGVFNPLPGFSHSLKTRLPLKLSDFFTFSTKNLEKIQKLIIFQALG